MASKFSTSNWNKISALMAASAQEFGLPDRRKKSVIIGTFNIRKLGAVKKRSTRSWEFLRDTIAHFDLIAVQEIMDDLSGFEHLRDMLGKDYDMVISDVTGVKPGSSGNPERLGFLFNRKRIEHTALASDITYDRSEIANNLYTHRAEFDAAWKEHTEKLEAWEEKKEIKKAQGKKQPTKPAIELPRFVSFIRQPHFASFRIKGGQQAKPYEFLVVNAHLLYGENKREREWEFRALVEWLTVRAKQADKLYYRNLLLLGDCNLDFDEDVTAMRDDVDAFIKGLNKSVLKSKKAATANFPMLSPHPTHGILRTALRQEQTYDQIGLFIRDRRLPTPEDNKKAGTQGPDAYDYGVFNMANLIAHALHDKDLDKLTKSQRKSLYKKAEFDISDHMPAWIRLKLPE